MDEDIKIALVTGGVGATLCFITTTIINGGFNSLMEVFLNNILPAIIAGVISLISGLLLARHSQIKKNTAAIGELSRQLGDFSERSLSNRIGNADKLSLSDQYSDIMESMKNATGVDKDRPSLSKQHEDLSKLLEKEIDIVEKRYDEENKKIQSFSFQEKDIYDKIEDLKTLMQSWLELTEDTKQMQIKIYELEADLKDSQTEVSRLEKENSVLQEKLYPHRDNQYPTISR